MLSPKESQIIDFIQNNGPSSSKEKFNLAAISASYATLILPVVPCFFLYHKELHVGSKGAKKLGQR
jgi:hypothetical protein